MTDWVPLIAANLLSPIILFFVLGAVAAALKSDLAVPESIGKALSLYLMIAIGFKGGIALGANDATGPLAGALLAALALSLLLPLLAFGLLRSFTELDIWNAAAVAAHYGSVSIVTFVAATGYLDNSETSYEGYMVALLAVMETPAIVTGLLLARRAPMGRSATPNAVLSPEVLREVFLSGGVVLLAGSFLIGAASGEQGLKLMAAVLVDPFNGILALFLLDMGLLVGRRLRDFGQVGWPLVAFGIYMPLLGGGIGLAVAHALGLSEGGRTLLTVLAASASYIVVPAAMRLSLPQANPTIYVTLSLAVTFPFNLLVGIPLYHAAAQFTVRL